VSDSREDVLTAVDSSFQNTDLDYQLRQRGIESGYGRVGGEYVSGIDGEICL
jgi:hypothetical protein